MATRQKFENVLYHQKRAHKVWLGEVTRRGRTPSDEANNLVWELLVSYGEAVENLEQAREDAYKTAYELATLELTELHIEQIFELYRDCLLYTSRCV